MKQLYPLIVHLPLALILIFALKKPVGVAVVSVCTAYLCCQLPRWVNLSVTAMTGSAVAGELCYTLLIGPIFLLLRRFFVRPAYEAMTLSPQSLWLFGSLPVAYYVFDYATVVYADALGSSVQALNEFLPTALIIFYVLFLSAYHRQLKSQADGAMERSMLQAQLKQAAVEMSSLRQAETQMAVYQHDIRHHMNAIDGLLAAGEPERARAYIQKVRSDVEAVVPQRFCANELVNLLCSSFSKKAEGMGIELRITALLPEKLALPDTELCSLLSNGLENALHAAPPPGPVTLYCGVRQNKLLIEISNPYDGEITFRDGLPAARQQGHGYGCRSIRTIVQRHRGLCSFDAEGGLFPPAGRPAHPSAAGRGQGRSPGRAILTPRIPLSHKMLKKAFDSFRHCRTLFFCKIRIKWY